MTRPHGLAGAAAACVLALLLTACSPGGAPAPSTAPAASTPSAAVSTCVLDPAATIAAGATPANTAPLPADLAAQLDAAAAGAFSLSAAPGAVVGVQTPEGTWTAAYGVADITTGAPMAVGMHTRIASLTKMYTGTIVLQLAEEGAISLDDTVSQYLDGIPNGETITLRQLADMTSGFASYTRNDAFVDAFFADPTAVYTPDELIAAAIPESPLFDPGERFDYSNSNTVLLGLIVEEVTGEPFGDVLQERIVAPLGLDGTSWPGDSAALPEPFAHGYTLDGDQATPDAPADATGYNPSFAFTAGEIISTIDDLLVFGRAVGTGDGLLGGAAQTERLESFLDPSQGVPVPGAGGYGLAMGCGEGWVGHTGEFSGYNTALFYDTATATTVAVQTTSNIASGGCENSPTLTDDPGDAACQTPAVRILVDLSSLLGVTYQPPPRS